MTASPPATPSDPAEARPMRVEHRSGDRFVINVRGHLVLEATP